MANLSDPLTFRHGASINNRFVQPPMLTNSGKDGYATPDTINYYRHHAKSGGMIITEYVYVSENGGPALSWADDREQLAIYDDKFIPQLKKVATAIKQAGNKAIMQIAHTGRQANGRAAQGKPVYAPSAVDFPFLPYKVHELTDEQIKDIIADFGKATKRAIEAGFDGVEIHGANHYLIQQFFSKYSNRRTDHWGGSLEKRMNFPLAVVKSVMDAAKESAPDDFIIGYRISPEEIHGQNIGYTWRESTQLIKKITSQFDLDYVHLSMGQYNAKPTSSDPTFISPEEVQSDDGKLTQEILQKRHQEESSDQQANKTFAELFNDVLDDQTKEIIVGGITTPEQAKDAIKYSDLVAVGRANIIDPLFAEKVLNHQDDQIIKQITPELTKQNGMTPGMIDNFSAKDPLIPLPGAKMIQSMHQHFGSWSEVQYPDTPDMKKD